MAPQAQDSSVSYVAPAAGELLVSSDARDGCRKKEEEIEIVLYGTFKNLEKFKLCRNNPLFPSGSGGGSGGADLSDSVGVGGASSTAERTDTNASSDPRSETSFKEREATSRTSVATAPEEVDRRASVTSPVTEDAEHEDVGNYSSTLFGASTSAANNKKPSSLSPSSPAYFFSLLQRHGVREISCGAHFFGVLTLQGSVGLFGWNSPYVYGHVHEFLHLELPTPALQIACGLEHTLILCQDQSVGGAEDHRSVGAAPAGGGSGGALWAHGKYVELLGLPPSTAAQASYVEGIRRNAKKVLRTGPTRTVWRRRSPPKAVLSTSTKKPLFEADELYYTLPARTGSREAAGHPDERKTDDVVLVETGERERENSIKTGVAPVYLQEGTADAAQEQAEAQRADNEPEEPPPTFRSADVPLTVRTSASALSSAAASIGDVEQVPDEITRARLSSALKQADTAPAYGRSYTKEVVFVPVTTIAAKNNYSVCATDEGSLYHWGCVPFLCRTIEEPALLAEPPNISSAVSSSPANKSQKRQFQQNKAPGAGGAGAPPFPSHHHHHHHHHKVVRIAISSHATIVLDSKGVCRAYGDGTYGETASGANAGGYGRDQPIFPGSVLAVGILTSSLSFGEILDIGEPVVDVKCGEAHTLCLGKSGAMYAFGEDTYGQCGCGLQNRSRNGLLGERVLVPRQIRKLQEAGVGPPQQGGGAATSSMKTATAPSDACFQFSAGHYHSTLTTEQGNLFTWGSIKAGPLQTDPFLQNLEEGTPSGVKSSWNRPKLCAHLLHRFCQFAECGPNYTVVVYGQETEYDTSTVGEADAEEAAVRDGGVGFVARGSGGADDGGGGGGERGLGHVVVDVP